MMTKSRSKGYSRYFVLLLVITSVFVMSFLGCEKKTEPVAREEVEEQIASLRREQRLLREEIEELREEVGRLRIEQDEIAFMLAMDDEIESPLMKSAIQISLIILLLIIILLFLYTLYQRKVRRENLHEDVVITSSEEEDEGADSYVDEENTMQDNDDTEDSEDKN